MLEAEIILLPTLFWRAFSNMPRGCTTPNPMLPSYATVNTSLSIFEADIICLPMLFWRAFSNIPWGCVTPNPMLPS